jgi:plastocyanin
MRPATFAPRTLGILLACATMGAAAAARAAEHTVVIDGLQFRPAELTVHRGERIVWLNKDPLPHSVTADSKLFDSGSIAAAGSWSYIAGKRGEYAYHCIFHPTMQGKIRVQ